MELLHLSCEGDLCREAISFLTAKIERLKLFGKSFCVALTEEGSGLKICSEIVNKESIQSVVLPLAQIFGDLTRDLSERIEGKVKLFCVMDEMVREGKVVVEMESLRMKIEGDPTTIIHVKTSILLSLAVGEEGIAEEVSEELERYLGVPCRVVLKNSRSIGTSASIKIDDSSNVWLTAPLSHLNDSSLARLDYVPPIREPSELGLPLGMSRSPLLLLFIRPTLHSLRQVVRQSLVSDEQVPLLLFLHETFAKYVKKRFPHVREGEVEIVFSRPISSLPESLTMGEEEVMLVLRTKEKVVQQSLKLQEVLKELEVERDAVLFQAPSPARTQTLA